MTVVPPSTGRMRSARLLDRIVFAGLLCLIITVNIPYGSVDLWWEAAFECGVFALTAIWIFELLLRGNWPSKKILLLLPLILFVVYAFLQTMQLPGLSINTAGASPLSRHTLTIDRYQTHLTAVKILAVTLFTALLLLHTSTPKRLRWLVRVILGLGLGSAIFGILRQLLQSPDSTAGFVLPFLFPNMGYAQFISSNVYAFLAEMEVGLLAGLVLGGGIRRQHVLIYLAIILVIWATLVLSNSRGAILSFICQSIFLLFVGLGWYSSRNVEGEGGVRFRLLAFIQSSRLIQGLVIVLITGTLIVGLFWMGGEKLASKLEQASTPGIAAEGTSRKEIWHSTWQVIKHNPWTGVGFGAYFLAIPEYQTGSGSMKLQQAHNDYLDLAASGGVIAIGLAAWFVVILMSRARFAFRSKDSYRRATALGAVAAILGVGIHSLFDFGLQVPGIAVVFAALVVIVFADIPVERKSRVRPL
jgi:O-antigen ligase